MTVDSGKMEDSTQERSPAEESDRPGPEAAVGEEDGGSPPSPRRHRLLSLAWKVPLGVLIATVLLVLPFRWLPPPTTSFIERSKS